MQRYLDANVFIFPVIEDEKTDKKVKLCKEILLKVSEGTLDAATSSLTWDEVIWTVRKFIGEKESVDEGKKFLNFPNLKILSIDEKIISEAQKLLEKYNLKPRDSIHAACAIENNINEIISDDPDFDKVSELKRIGLEDRYE